MGHRHLFGASQMFEGDHDQNWNHVHADQPHLHMDNGSFFYPSENRAVDGVRFSAHWNSAMRSNGYPPSSHGIPHYQSDGSGPSSDPFPTPSSSGTFCGVPENYYHYASSSNYERQSYHVVDGGFSDLPVGNMRAINKRKSPGIPSVSEVGSTSRYYCPGSSSDVPVSSEVCQEKLNMDSQHMPRDPASLTSTYRTNGLSIGGDGSMRNVRSRPVLDIESNLARTHLSSNISHTYSTSHTVHRSHRLDHPGQSSSALTWEWNHDSMPYSHGRLSGSDTSSVSHETSHLNMGSSASNTSVDFGGYHNDYVSSRSSIVPHSFHGNSTQSVRGVRSRFPQRTSPTLRASSSNLRLENVVPSDDGLQLIAENYSSRHPRPVSTVGWRGFDRNWRSRTNERYRSDEPGLHDRLSPEGFMVVDRTAFYGSRTMLDQHRDMRLDIDNMSYEELLALGERIGSVNTGLSEDLISKCLTETIYCSSDQTQEEGTCVVCLEEYKIMDHVGALKTCGHDYHVKCVKKWLSLKNSCPICKASALAEDKLN